MRVVPGRSSWNEPFRLGCELAAITHGHASGFLAAGFFAAGISALTLGASLSDAIATATDQLRGYPEHEECLAAVERAVRRASMDAPSAEHVELVGRRWVAEEALAIALYCALTADGDFQRGVRLAVNHSGDSDSTGSMTGNFSGRCSGKKRSLPVGSKRWNSATSSNDVRSEVCRSGESAQASAPPYPGLLVLLDW